MEENRKAHATSPAAPYQAALIFAATSLLFFGSLYLLLPLLRDTNVSWFACFNLVLAIPMFLLVALAAAAYALEGGTFCWSSVRDRFRLGRMGISSWFWTLGVAIFMWGGRYANLVAFVAVLPALSCDRQLTREQRLKLAVGVAAYLTLAWMLWRTRSWFTSITLHPLPQTLQQFLAHLTAADAFMDLPLKGQWWIAIYYAFVLLFGNIAGEELWWRGYLLPRQELASGPTAWVYHGVFWAGFHLFFQATAWDLIHMVPTCCALAFVAQHRKSTWPGIVAHTVGNMGVMLGIVRGVLT